MQKIDSFFKENNNYDMPIELLNNEQELKERMARVLKLIGTFANEDESINREMESIFMKIDEIQGLFVKNFNVFDQGDISKN